MDAKKEIGNYLKTTREENNIDLNYIKLKTDIPAKEMLQYEEGKLPITKHTLKILSRVMPIPRKYKQLAIDDKKSNFANHITQLRVINNRSQTETAELLGIAQTTYAGYETGKYEPNIDMLMKIADLYNVSVDYIIGRYLK